MTDEAKNNRLDECPVCHGDGFYYYKDEKHECPDDDYGHVMLRLARFYWMHNVRTEHQSLLWDEFPHEEDKKEIENYIANYKRLRMAGLGITFTGGLGVGKTWAATHILREILKEGYPGWFASFLDFKDYFELEDRKKRDYLIGQARSTELLVLDEVKAPWSEAARRFFEDQLEPLIRHRTSSNFPTLVTTNMDKAEFSKEFPRIHSLLSAKNMVINLVGTDARVNGPVFQNQAMLAMRGEARPIT